MRSATLARAGIATAATMGLLISAIRWANVEALPGPPITVLGFTAVYLAPAAFAYVGHRRGDGPTLAAAAILCALAAVTAFSGVTLPFILPAVLLASAAAGRPWQWRSRVSAAGVVLLAGAAWFAVATIQDADSAPIALVLVGVALGIALVMASTTPPIIPNDGHPADARQP
jgi:hypothetical protein